jgi:type IV pilus assembly protein PilA
MASVAPANAGYLLYLSITYIGMRGWQSQQFLTVGQRSAIRVRNPCGSLFGGRRDREEGFQEETLKMRKQKGFSLIELLIVVAIILIIAAIAIPNLLRARILANDSAAASTLRTINTAEVTYSTTYPGQGYSPDLKTLGPNGINCGTAAPTLASACLVDDVLGCAAAPCKKGGYQYWIVSGSAAAPFGDYTASATPTSVSVSGTRNWCSNPDAVIRQSAVGATKLANGETLGNCGDVTKYNAASN